MAMNRIVTYVELESGEVLGPFRVTHRHRARWEQMCKRVNLDAESAAADERLAWIVSTAEPDTPINGLSLDAWREQVFDATNQKAEDGEAQRGGDAEDEGVSLDPTRPDRSGES
ncbi:MAG: hypothetical protein Q4G34_00190 [Micrococcus sp.]|nr:hypothetical protein [Micrococcus sp.]